jgi:thymidylate synthase (FAD)
MTDVEIELTSEITVRLIQHMGSDQMIAAAAKVSTSPEEARALETVESSEGLYGLIRYLAKLRHTSPFEHSAITFYVEAPIFVFREWHRHRIASYSEMSGRYTELLPKFWVPRASRNLIPVPGYKAARPIFGPAPSALRAEVQESLGDSYAHAWETYQSLLAQNIAKEVARACLPVAVFSKMWVTANLHSWLHFLSLRVHDPNAQFVSYPQAEIEQAAVQVEAVLTSLFPLALRAFNETGRSF